MSDSIITQGEKVIKTFMTGTEIAKARGELSKMKKFTTTAFEVLGDLDRLINEVDFKLEAIEDQCASLNEGEDHRYCGEHDKEYELIDGTFQCPSCVLMAATGYPYECEDHGLHDGGCEACASIDRSIDDMRERGE